MKQKENPSPYIKIDALLIPVLPTRGPARPILPEAQRLRHYPGPLELSIIYGPSAEKPLFTGAGLVPAQRQLLCFLLGGAGPHPRVQLPGCRKAAVVGG